MKRIIYLTITFCLIICCTIHAVNEKTEAIKSKIPNCIKIGNVDWNGLYAVEISDSLYGMVDSSAHFVIPPVFNTIYRRQDTWISCYRGKNWHLYNLKYPRINWVNTDNRKYRIEDNNFKTISDTIYEDLCLTDDWMVFCKKGKSWGYIDSIGVFQPIENMEGCDMPDGYRKYEDYQTISKEGKFGLADKHLNIVIPVIYDHIELLKHIGKIIVKKDGKYGILSTDNKVIQPLKFDSIVSIKGLFPNSQLPKDKIYRYYDETEDCEYGEIFIQEECSYVPLNSDCFCNFQCFIRGKRVILDTDGKSILAKELLNMKDYDYTGSDGIYIRANNKSKKEVCLYINPENKYICPEGVFSLEADPVTKCFIAVGNKGKKGVINNKCETIVPIEFDDVKYDYGSGKYICYRNGEIADRYILK